MAQEATRLADLGLEPKEIAARLDVNRSTVTRWMAAGKLQRTARSAAPRADAQRAKPTGKSPAEWAAAVREAYALDATDEQLVTLAESALETAQDQRESAQVRLSAMGRFQAVVKQLALVTRGAEDDMPIGAQQTPEVKKPLVTPRVRTYDPRAQLMAVK
jgi:hypothetical protein